MKTIITNNTRISVADSAYPGVKRIAGYVNDDIAKVFRRSESKNTAAATSESESKNTAAAASEDESQKPAAIASETESAVASRTESTVASNVYVYTLNKDEVPDIIDTTAIAGKREVYLWIIINEELYIVGSDKRGTIYGMFHLSEVMGVSPFVNWGDVMPAAKNEVIIDESMLLVSKEPSVRYRGFFINDEWPAFGTWCNERFGGFNAKCYERVFELLLRLKGNYMWPAMWAARFNMDGPDLDNAILADEMGVVMGMSHHEPCNRSGEEYKYVRGPKSIYGDDWNFVRNREGITKFWEDGLKRCAPYETVITVGMRGEADSTILGHEATLADNIEYLRDVLKTQEKLIKECVNKDIMSVPRMLALYKEVEPFFYGDETTPGLMDSPELEGVTLMLCDDNFGNLRTLPTEHMREHNGGYGMYYHFDYHGAPISYEWVNSSYLPKVHQNMCTAYENGIRDLWIVNVGDIFTTEFPLAFFLDLAYDYDKWGITNKHAGSEYTKLFIDRVFPTFSQVEREATFELLEGYTRIASNRRPETLNADRILENYPEDDLDELYRECIKLRQNCEMMYQGMRPLNKFSFFEFVYYPLMGNVNTHMMQLLAAQNKFLSSIGAVKANELNSSIMDMLAFDKELVDMVHTEHDGFWTGMGLSEHIGFIHWNEEENINPTLHQVIGTNKAGIVAVNPKTREYTQGGDWTGRVLKVYTDDEAVIDLFATSYNETKFKVTVEGKLNVNAATGEEENLIGSDGVYPLCIMLKNDGLHNKADAKKTNGLHNIIGTITVITDRGRIKIEVYPKIYEPVKRYELSNRLKETSEVTVEVPEEGEYELRIHMMPTNPPFTDNKLEYEYSINGESHSIVNAVGDDFKVGDNALMWYVGVLNNDRVSSVKSTLKSGKNLIVIKPLSEGMVLKKLVICRLM